MKLKKLHVLIITFLLLFSCGCLPTPPLVAYRAGNIPPVENWPPPSLKVKKSIRVLVNVEITAGEENTKVSFQTYEDWRALIIKTYWESGLFSRVSVLKEADLSADVIIRYRESSTRWKASKMFGAVFSAFLAPYLANNELTVKTTIIDRERKILGQLEKTETITLSQGWNHLSSKPQPGEVINETVYDISRTTINEMLARELFN